MCQLVIVLVAFVTFCFFKQLNLEPTLNTKVIFKLLLAFLWKVWLCLKLIFLLVLIVLWFLNDYFNSIKILHAVRLNYGLHIVHVYLYLL